MIAFVRLHPARIAMVLSVALASAPTAMGQTWTNFTSTAAGGALWSASGNWSPGLPDFVTSPSSTVLTFGGTPPLGSPFQPTGNYFSTIDQAFAVNVNQLIFNNQGSPDATTFGVTIQSNNASGVLAFSGAGMAITQNGAGSVTLGNGTPAVDYTLPGAGQTLTINGSGNGHVTIAGVVGGTGNIAISHAASAPLGMGSLITLGNVNTFSGTTTLNSGNLVLGNATALGSGNTLVINGGTLRTNAALTVANPMTLNSQLYLTGASAPTFTGAIGGNGGILWQPFTVGTIATFQGAISGTGALASSGLLPQITLSGNGSALNSTNYNFNLAVLALDNSVTNIQRLNSASGATMSLLSSTISMNGNASSATTETVDNLILGGNGQFTLTPNAAQSLSLNFNTLSRTARDTFQVTTQGTGLNLGGAPGAAGNATLKFNNLNAGSNVNGILPYGFAATGTTAAPAVSFVRYDNTNGLVPLNLTTDYNTSQPYLVGNQPTANYRMPSTANTYGAVNTAISVNSLLMETPSGALLGSAIFGNGSITLTSGALLASITGGSTASTMTGTFIQPNIILGSAPGYFHTQNNAFIQGNITGSAGLVKSGTGLMYLNGDNSGLTGGVTINAGNVFFSNDNNLGAPGGAINFNGIGQGGGGLLNFIPTNLYGPATNSSIVISRPFNLGDAGGGVAVSQPGSTMEISGNITGSGRFYKLGSGNLVLSGNNTFAGELVVFGNTVAVNGAGAMGNNSTVILNSGAATFFQTNSTFSTNKNFLIVGTTAGTSIVTNESDLTISGQIGGNVTGTPLTKAGSGTLTLTNANLVNGAFTVGDTNATHRAGTDFAQTGGTLVLSGPNGAINQATSYTFNQGTTVLLDNSGVAGNVNQNRLSSSTVTMNGAELVLRGNANASMFEHVGRGNTAGTGLAITAGLGNTITVAQPASGGGQNTNLVFTSYQNPAVSAQGVVFFRGDNLGGSTGDFTNVTFVAAPTLTNGILSNGLYANSSTANPQDFATNSGGQIVGFASYTPLPASGGTNTVTHSLTGAQTMTAAQASNALKMSNGQLDLNGNNLSITGTGQLLSTGPSNADVITSSVIGGTNLVFTGASAKFTVNSSLDVGTAASPVGITTASGLTKFGPGELRISSATGVTGGGYNIAQGSIKLLTAGALTTGQTVTMAPGASLDINSFGTTAAPVTVNGLAGFGTVKLGSGALSTGGGTTSTTYGGSFEGTASSTLIKSNTGTLTLIGNSPNFSGGVQILGGAMTIDSNVRPSNVTRPGPLGTGTSAVQLGATSGTATATLNLGVNLNRFERDIFVPTGVANTTVFSLVMATGQYATMTGGISLGRELRLNGPFSSTANPAGAVTLTGNITETGAGLGSLDVLGGNWNFWGNNSYSGRTFFEASLGNVMGVGTDSAFGTGPMIIANQSFTASFRADFGPRTLANTFGFESGTTANSIQFVGTNDLTFTSPTVDLAGGTRTWNVLSTGITTFTGNLINGNATTGLIKNGGGTLVLAGSNNTYAGATTVNQGVLLVNGTLAAGGGAVTVGTGAILGGSGTINRAVNVNAGGIIKPGNSPGVLTVGNNLTLASGSTANFQIQGATPGNGSGFHSQIVANGSGAAINISGANLVLDFAGATYTPSNSDRIVLFDYSAGPAVLTGTFSGLPDDSIAVNNVLGSGLNYFIYYGTLTGYANKIVLSPVPEPLHILLVGAAGAMGYRWVRRRQLKNV